MPRGPKGEKRPAADLTLILYRASKESAPARGGGLGPKLRGAETEAGTISNVVSQSRLDH